MKKIFAFLIIVLVGCNSKNKVRDLAGWPEDIAPIGFKDWIYRGRPIYANQFNENGFISVYNEGEDDRFDGGVWGGRANRVRITPKDYRPYGSFQEMIDHFNEVEKYFRSQGAKVVSYELPETCDSALMYKDRSYQTGDSVDLFRFYINKHVLPRGVAAVYDKAFPGIDGRPWATWTGDKVQGFKKIIR